jgi:hypothetical protein
MIALPDRASAPNPTHIRAPLLLMLDLQRRERNTIAAGDGATLEAELTFRPTDAGGGRRCRRAELQFGLIRK